MRLLQDRDARAESQTRGNRPSQRSLPESRLQQSAEDHAKEAKTAKTRSGSGLTGPLPPENAKFDVAEDLLPRREVLDAEEDEQSRREREAALASTFDQTLAHNGKTDEELIEERQDDMRALGDVAIAVAIAIAVTDDDGVSDAHIEIVEEAPVEADGE